MNRPTIFFDFDGTILNSFSLYYKTTKHLFPELDEREYRSIFEAIDFSTSPLIKSENKEEFFSLIEKHSHLYEIFPGVLEGMHRLAPQFDLVIVSACPKAIIKYQLSRFELPQFKRIYGSEKPGNKREKIQSYCERNEIAHDHCFFVTDTLGDILMLKPIKIPTIAVTYGFHDQPTLETGCPDYTCNDFTQVTRHITQNKKTL